MPDQFGGIAVEDKPAADQFGGVPVEQAATQAPAFTGSDGIAVAKNVYASLGPILSAFGHGAKEGWGDEPIGVPDEAAKWLSDKGIFGPEKGGYQNPFQAFNELLAHTVVGAVQIGTRTVNAAFGAYQAGVAETGEQVGAPSLGRDLAAMPEAFFGSAHPMAEIKTRSGLPHDEPVGVPANPILGPAGFDAYHGSPHSFDAFSTAAIGTGEGAQAYGHGLYFAESEGVARSYRDALGGDSATVEGKKYDPYNPVHAAAAQIEESGSREAAIKDMGAIAKADNDPMQFTSRVLSILKADRELPKIENATGNLYQVRINVDQDKMLDYDKPISAQGPQINQSILDAVKTAEQDQGVKWEPFTADDTGADVVQRLNALGKDRASSILREAGIPGIRYLDAGSRVDPVEIARLKANVEIYESDHERSPSKYTKERLDAAQNELDQYQNKTGTRNFVVFNEGDIQITHKNGVPIPTPLDHINEARDLGVIGPPKPDMTDASPAEKAAAEVPPPPKIMAAARTGDDTVRSPMPAAPEKAGNIRLGQIGINADAKDVILDAAKNNDDFNQARQGNVPLAQVESLSGASGVPSETLTGNDGLGRLMHNDAVVRTWLQAFHQATDEIADQMQTVARTGDEGDIANLREMKLRFQHMQEQVSGLTAEAGRTLGVFREFYANKGKAEALGKILEDNPGMDADSLKKLADTGAGLNDPATLARYLHDSNKPTFWDKYLYYWTNALISGPVTHAKYIGANLAFGAYEAGVVTPIAGALGTVRRALTRGAEERVTSAAVKFNDKIYTGANHLEALEKAAAENGTDVENIHTKADDNKQSQFDSWVTSSGRFIDSKEAAKLVNSSHEKLDSSDPEFQQQRSARNTDGVYVGEAAARAWGLLAGTPDALKAAWTAAKNNVMTPFENEVAGKAVNPLTQTRPNPIGGKLGFALGIPGRSAAGIHSFFRFLGYRAEIEAQAYRQAAKEGLSPTGQAFWDRRGALADQPTDAMMNAGIENGNHLTFIGEQGKFGKLMSSVANFRATEGDVRLPFTDTKVGAIQPFKLILPFTHIPGQILRAGIEQTPAAFLDTKMRSDLLGSNGAVAADTARARLVAGGAVSAMVANWAVNDTITGYGPTDQTERAQWLRTHEPYSVRLGGWWYSYNKFGPIGDLAGLVANLVEVGPKVADNDYADAAGHVMKATSRMLEDEVGMQGLVNLLDAMDDPDKKMARFVSGQAASNLPYSSLLRQGASVTDPYMREAKTFVDQLRYAVPWARQDLLPKRDWLGAPMTNPGYASIIRQRAVNDDPVDLAVSQLRGFRPAPPEARIGGVALPPKLYDEFQTTAGAMTRAGLEPIVTSPRWGEIPPGIREQTVHSIVENARKTAGSMLQARHPEIIMQGISNRNDKISGTKPSKLSD